MISPYKRLEYRLKLALYTLRSIAALPKNTLPRRLARSTVEFMEAMERNRKRGKK